MSALSTENALEVMAIIGFLVCLIGIGAGSLWTIPTTLRDMHHAVRGSPESVVYRYDLYGALLGVLGLVCMLAAVIAILFLEPAMSRSAITRPTILTTLICLAAICVLAPLRRRAIQRAAERDSS